MPTKPPFDSDPVGYGSFPKERSVPFSSAISVLFTPASNSPISRESRKLTRTILTQCVHHVAASSPSLDRYYQELREKRATGRARIAVIRKLCGMMRRMLLSGEQYRWMDQQLYGKKLRQYERVLKRAKEERPAA